MDSTFCKSKTKQKLLNNPCEAPENSPASWCKKSGEASSSATADFLLEAEKRGSPPKSEKRQLLARRGSEVGGAALLRKEKDNNEIAESNRDSSRCRAQNDEFLDCHADSANLLAMTKKNKCFAESVVNSTANSSIVDKFLGFCEASDEDRTQSSSTRAKPKQSLKSRLKARICCASHFAQNYALCF